MFGQLEIFEIIHRGELSLNNIIDHIRLLRRKEVVV